MKFFPIFFLLTLSPALAQDAAWMNKWGAIIDPDHCRPVDARDVITDIRVGPGRMTATVNGYTWVPVTPSWDMNARVCENKDGTVHCLLKPGAGG